MAKWVAAIALVMAFALGACAHQDGADLDNGRRIAQQNCASCHAIGAYGSSPQEAAPPFRTLSRNYPVTALDEAFAEGILVGHEAMPPFQLAADDINDLVSYLQSVQERPGA